MQKEGHAAAQMQFWPDYYYYYITIIIIIII